MPPPPLEHSKHPSVTVGPAHAEDVLTDIATAIRLRPPDLTQLRTFALVLLLESAAVLETTL